MSKRIVILGAGGYSNTISDVAEQLGYELVAMLDDKLPGLELSTFHSYISADTEFIPAFDDNQFRLKWIDKLQSMGTQIATRIHPTAYVSPRATIKPGTVILPKSIVNTDVVIERGCIVNIGAIIDHGTMLEEGVHLAPGAIVKVENRIKSCLKVESGEVVPARQWSV